VEGDLSKDDDGPVTAGKKRVLLSRTRLNPARRPREREKGKKFEVYQTKKKKKSMMKNN